MYAYDIEVDNVVGNVSIQGRVEISLSWLAKGWSLPSESLMKLMLWMLMKKDHVMMPQVL